MQFVLASIYLFLIVLSFRKRKDLFSPLKVYLLTILVFWGKVFVVEYNFITTLCFLAILLFGFFILIFEGNQKLVTNRKKIDFSNRSYIWKRLWLLTLIPLYFQYDLIQAMGGLERYIWSMGLRVVEWKGYGFHILMIRSILVINLLYFVIIVKNKKNTPKEKIGFVANFSIYIILAFLTSSRSTLLVNIFLMMIIYYYNVKPIKFSKISLTAIGLILIALILGVARNGYGLEDGKLKTGLSNNSNKKIELANFSYGLFPLEKVTEEEYIKSYYYGKTYLSVITNLVPRKYWENKPPTGGVVFTKDYHDVHNGYSNYSTGIFVEGFINFGFFTGSAVSLIILILIYTLFFGYLNKNRMKTSSQKSVIFALVYPNLLFLLPTYLHGEFTTVTHTIFIQKILLILIFTKIVIPKKNEFKRG